MNFIRHLPISGRVTWWWVIFIIPDSTQLVESALLREAHQLPVFSDTKGECWFKRSCKAIRKWYTIHYLYTKLKTFRQFITNSTHKTKCKIAKSYQIRPHNICMQIFWESLVHNNLDVIKYCWTYKSPRRVKIQHMNMRLLRVLAHRIRAPPTQIN